MATWSFDPCRRANGIHSDRVRIFRDELGQVGHVTVQTIVKISRDAQWRFQARFARNQSTWCDDHPVQLTLLQIGCSLFDPPQQ